jgi:UDP-3-O-[3-hydroxymyristoyl] glucosamine N-acyltransferase
VLGERSVIAAGAGVLDHVTIADDVQLGARSLVTRDIREPGQYTGQPARPTRQQLRVDALLPRLQELFDRVRDMEQQLGQRQAHQTKVPAQQSAGQNVQEAGR